jgi:hypothetical protein
VCFPPRIWISSILFLFTVEEAEHFLLKWAEPDSHGASIDFYHIAIQAVRESFLSSLWENYCSLVVRESFLSSLWENNC